MSEEQVPEPEESSAEDGPEDPFEVPPMTAVGMELNCSTLEEMAHPIAAMVVLKSLEGDGEIAYRTLTTDGLTAVEALGMADFAKIQYRDMITMMTTHRACDHDDDDYVEGDEE